MGAPKFTEAELRRTMKVAREFGAHVELNPRAGTIRIVVATAEEPLASPSDAEAGEDAWDAAFQEASD